MRLSVTWRKCQGDIWCSFSNLHLEHETFKNAYGIYIIWAQQTTLKIGKGIIKDEIAKDRNNTLFGTYSDVRVTWCQIDPNSANGVVAFLNSALHPIVKNDVLSLNANIEVNFPWS